MTPSSAITRFELGSTLEEFDLKMNQQGFIGSRVFRPRPVGKNAADVGKVPLKQLLQSRSTKRAPGAAYNRNTWEFDKYAYAVAEYGQEEPLDDSQLAMFGDIVDAERICADRAEDAVISEYERDCASAAYDTATWTGAALTTAVVNEWDDPNNATPIEDVNGAREKIVAGSALEPNALILNRFQWRNLINTDQLVDRVKFTARPTQAEMAAAVADLLDLKFILVAGGMKNTANEGQAAAISRIWSNEYAMLARVAESDDPREPSIGRTFIWDGDGPGAPGDGGQLAVIMEEYREEKVRGDVFRARNNRDIVVMYAQAAHLLSNITT
jgi:hypothetical protein